MENIIVEKNRNYRRSVKVGGICVAMTFSMGIPIVITQDVHAAKITDKKSSIQEPIITIEKKKKAPVVYQQEVDFEEVKEEIEKREAERQKELEQNIITIHGYKYQLHPGELEFLKKVVYAESRGASVQEQMATTETILNRVAKHKTTITKVLRAKHQFQCVKSDGNVYTGMEPNLKLVTNKRIPKELSDAVEAAVYSEDDITESLLRAEAVKNGLDPETYAAGGALYFYEADPRIVSKMELKSRENIKVMVKIGEGEHFYYKVWDK